MLAVLYFILCITSGYVIIGLLFPGMGEMTKTTFRGTPLQLSRVFLLLPAWFVSGTLIMTWSTYLLAYCFRAKESPLMYANAITMPVFFFFSVVGILWLLRKKSRKLQDQFQCIHIGEIIFIGLSSLLVVILMWRTFFVSHDQLYVGLSVFSDFAPHLGMIRSFSHGNNFPTVYSHFTGEDIRYHFMFQFLVGNLEYLGMRIDWAFNLPSAVSMISVFSLLYVLAVRISGKRAVGYLSGLFFAFRCSPSFFTYLAKIPQGSNILQTIRENISFIGYTPKEEWGLWNLNVYCNQRHLAFGICVLLIIINLFIPLLYSMADRWQVLVQGLEDKGWKNRLKQVFRFSFLSKEGWLPKSIVCPIAAGVLLGLSAFWNGATLLAAIMILFFLAIISDRRLEFLITAVITAVLSLVQTNFFIHGENMMNPEFLFGFIAENPTLFGTLRYIALLCGILPLVLAASLCVMKGVRRYLLFSFSIPFIFSFLVSLTVDVTVNHKYIMVSIMLMNIFAAVLLVRLFENKNLILRILCGLIVFVMTITGIYDFRTVRQRNLPAYDLVFSMEDPLVEWIDENTDSQDIFLTAPYALSRAVLGGAMLFEGHAYYPMTAGYDTDTRYQLMRQMFEAESQSELIRLIEENKIDYVIIDIDTRQSEEFDLNERVFEETFESVYTEGSGDWKLTVYDVNKLKK